MSSKKNELIEAISLASRESQNWTAQFDELAAALLGINLTDLRCIDVVERNDERMTAGELARATGLTTGAITALLDRMEAAGYLLRGRDPADRRRVTVQLTPKAHAAADPIYGPLSVAFERFMAGFTLAELELLWSFFERARKISAAQLERVREMRAS